MIEIPGLPTITAISEILYTIHRGLDGLASLFTGGCYSRSPHPKGCPVSSPRRLSVSKKRLFRRGAVNHNCWKRAYLRISKQLFQKDDAILYTKFIESVLMFVNSCVIFEKDRSKKV